MDQVQAEMVSMQTYMDKFLARVNEDGLQHRGLRNQVIPRGEGAHVIPPGGVCNGNRVQTGAPIPSLVGEGSAARAVHDHAYDDQQDDVFSMKILDADIPTVREDKILQLIQEQMEGDMDHNTLGMDFDDLGLVPGVVIPHKFQVLTFDKYNGMTCPKNHVKAYGSRMVAHAKDDKLMMHYF